MDSVFGMTYWADSKYDLVIIDELGYLPMNRQGNYNLFQLINALYEYRSIILTTNKDFTAWGEFFVDENVAVPIIDRLIHHSNIFMLGGDSYRLKHKTNTWLFNWEGGQYYCPKRGQLFWPLTTRRDRTYEAKTR